MMVLKGMVWLLYEAAKDATRSIYDYVEGKIYGAPVIDYTQEELLTRQIEFAKQRRYASSLKKRERVIEKQAQSSISKIESKVSTCNNWRQRIVRKINHKKIDFLSRDFDRDSFSTDRGWKTTALDLKDSFKELCEELQCSSASNHDDLSSSCNAAQEQVKQLQEELLTLKKLIQTKPSAGVAEQLMISAGETFETYLDVKTTSSVLKNPEKFLPTKENLFKKIINCDYSWVTYSTNSNSTSYLAKGTLAVAIFACRLFTLLVFIITSSFIACQMVVIIKAGYRKLLTELKPVKKEEKPVLPNEAWKSRFYQVADMLGLRGGDFMTLSLEEQMELIELNLDHDLMIWITQVKIIKLQQQAEPFLRLITTTSTTSSSVVVKNKNKTLVTNQDSSFKLNMVIGGFCLMMTLRFGAVSSRFSKVDYQTPQIIKYHTTKNPLLLKGSDNNEIEKTIRFIKSRAETSLSKDLTTYKASVIIQSKEQPIEEITVSSPVDSTIKDRQVKKKRIGKLSDFENKDVSPLEDSDDLESILGSKKFRFKIDNHGNIYFHE